MRFEKWQSLGNDYAIVEERELPFELSADRIRALCARHTGIGSDGLLLLSESRERRFVADVRIFNPDGSEAELSGNGVRQAVMYLRRNGWTPDDSFSVRTAAGEIRPRITGSSTCIVDMGRARLSSESDFPGGGDDGAGTITAAGREFHFQFVQVGNPQCPIEIPDGLEELEIGRYGREIERHAFFPNRTNVSFWRRTGDAQIRARIFERGVGETMASGTGAAGAAVAAVLRGVESPVTVHLDGGDLEVDVGQDLHLHVCGWASPVYRGTLSDVFLEGLRDAE
ncbi:MAG: diaminopimelate epimerase [Thermoleophilaceae bacterium]|nr:diaminopimelate epimerase [Thermoleophilaceae bacterium]